MHNEYITACCIRNKQDKLTLLKYSDIDITRLCPVLRPITLSLMNQCYSHVVAFHEANKDKKKYLRVESLVDEKIKDLAFIKKKFIEFFAKPGNKTKEDLLTYVFAYQFSLQYFNEYLYTVLVEFLRSNFTQQFWSNNNLNSIELNTLGLPNYYLFRNQKEELDTGPINIDYRLPIKEINDYLLNTTDLNYKLDLVRSIGKILDNFNIDEYNMFNPKFKDGLIDMVDNVKVDIDLEKSYQFTKRI